MNSMQKSLGLILTITLGAQVHAQTSVTYATTIPAPVAAGDTATVPGQTFDLVEATATNNPISVVIACGIFGTLEANACTTSGAAPASIGGGASIPSGLTGVTAGYSALAFNNNVTTSLSVTGNTAAVTTNSSIVLSGLELQQLQINYSGAAPPPASVGIDITYSLNASVTDNSTGTSAHMTQANTSIAVFDPATYSTTTTVDGDPSATAVFLARALAGSINAGTPAAALNQTNLLSLTPNKSYWVELGNNDAVLLSAGGADNLALSISGAVDPSFTVDPAWLAANPQYAGDLMISQVYNGSPVPLPATAWLLLSGLGGIAFLGRKRRALS